METKSSERIERLQSSGYRRLFECVKQEGIEPVKSFIDEIQSVKYEKDNIITQAVLYGKNDLLSLVKKHNDVIKYLREHEEDLRFLCLVNDNVLNVISSLSEDIESLELYLENAKRLENLGVENIILVDDFLRFNMDSCDIYRNADCGKIIYIEKMYTDGEITEISVETEVTDGITYKYSKIFFGVNDKSTTFRLRTQNNEHGDKFKSIEIKDFGFAADKLPAKEDIESYDIPNQLIRK